MIIASVLGAVTVAGFAPLYWFPLPVLTLAGLFVLWQRSTGARDAAVTGGCFGLGLFGAGVHWIYVSMHDFGAMPAALAVAATVLFCAILALFPALVGALGTRLRERLPAWLLWPVLWVLVEWFRGWVLTGFPWLVLGYSQVPHSPLAGLAPVLGIYGTSLGVALTAAALAALWRPGVRRARVLVALGLLWGGSAGLQAVPWTQPLGEPLTVSLLQGNVAQNLKWREDELVNTLRLYAGLVQQSKGRLIILPETALPLFAGEVPQGYFDLLADHARRQGGDVLVGVPERLRDGRTYNSMLSFGSAPAQTYRKHHLVPFGEFIPFKPLMGGIVRILQIPLSDFSRGDQVQAPMALAGQRVAVNICYEDVFGEEIIPALPAATLLVNVSNDAWFGDSFAPWQHLQIAQARALETGRPLLRATNTGVTALIDAHGHIVQRIPQFRPGILEASVYGRSGMTPYAHAGNGALLVLLALSVLGGVWWQRCHKAAGV